MCLCECARMYSLFIIASLDLRAHRLIPTQLCLSSMFLNSILVDKSGQSITSINTATTQQSAFYRYLHSLMAVSRTLRYWFKSKLVYQFCKRFTITCVNAKVGEKCIIVTILIDTLIIILVYYQIQYFLSVTHNLYQFLTCISLLFLTLVCSISSMGHLQ